MNLLETTIWQRMKTAYPATLRNDRLRLRVKRLLGAGDEAGAWDLLKAESIVRANAIRAKIEKSAMDVRIGFLAWKDEQQRQLTDVYTHAYLQLADRLMRVNPDSWHAYVHRGEVLRQLEELRLYEQEVLDEGLETAVDWGHRAAYAPVLAADAARLVGIAGPSTSMWGVVNERAVKALLANPPGGIPLSRRIWEHKKNAENGIHRVIATGVAQGQGVNQMLRAVREYMVEPFRSGTAAEKMRVEAHDLAARAKAERDLAADYRDRAGHAHDNGRQGESDKWTAKAVAAEERARALSRKARERYALARQTEFVPGKGLYKSWRDNARRMLREETNRAYQAGFLQAARAAKDYVLHRWVLSSGHHIPDVCDDFARADSGHGSGVYRVEDVPVIPHIGCQCYTVPVVQWGVLLGSKELAA